MFAETKNILLPPETAFKIFIAMIYLYRENYIDYG